MRPDRRFLFVVLLLCAAMSGCFFGENQKVKKVRGILWTGEEAVRLRQYDRAIKLYDSGLEIAPGEPSLLTGKSYALLMRGTERYNAALRLEQKQDKLDGIEAGKRDFVEAADVSAEAVKSVKSSKIREYVALLKEDRRRLGVFAERAEALRFVASYVDKNRTIEALEAIHEYLDIETDERRKTKVRLDAGKMLLETGNGEKALGEYKKILETEPDNSEALLGVGLALSQSGDTKQYKEAQFYFRRFVELAPADHKMRAEIEENLKYMKDK